MSNRAVSPHAGVGYRPLPPEALSRTEGLGSASVHIADNALQGVRVIPPWPDDHRDLDDSWADRTDEPRGRRYEVHSLFALLHLVIAHRQDGDAAYLRCGHDIIASWIAGNSREAPPSTHSWGGHASAQRTINICTFLDHAHDAEVTHLDLSPTVVEALLAHGTFLADTESYEPNHNHGIWQDYALMVVATHLRGWSQAGPWVTLAFERLQEQVRVGFSTEGVHLENSPSYQKWVVRLLRRISNYCEVVGLAPPSDLTTLIERAQEVLGTLVMPDGCLPPVGDTSRGLFHRSPSSKRQSERLAGFHVYPEAGYCVMRGRFYVFFTASNNLATHNHCDDLSLIVADDNGPLITDPGLLDYEKNSSRSAYTRSRTAHSTVTTRSEDPAIQPLALRIEASGEAESWMFCRARSRREGDIEHERSLLYDARRGHIVVVDRCQAPVPQTWERRFLFESDLSIRLGDDGLVHGQAASGRAISLRLWPQSARRSIVRAQEEPLQGWVAELHRELVPASCTIEVERGRHASFLSVFVPGQTAVNVVAAEAESFGFSVDGCEWLVSVGEEDVVIEGSDHLSIPLHVHSSTESPST